MSNNNHKYKMLIADDDKGSLNHLKMEFRDDYMVLLAGTSNEALEELFKPGNNDIAIIIADKKMPKASGIDFLREVKECQLSLAPFFNPLKKLNVKMSG